MSGGERRPIIFYLTQIKLSVFWFPEFFHFSEKSGIQIKKGVLLNGEPPTKEKQTKQKYENEFIFFSRSSASLSDVSHHLVICPRDLKSLFRMCKGF